MAIDLNDHSPNSNTLTNSGATESADTPFAASSISVDLEFSESDFLEAADSVSLSQTGDMTIEAWIKPESVSGFHFIVAKDDFAVAKVSYFLDINSISGIKIRFGISPDGATGNETTATTTTAFSTGSWQHIAVTYDASAGTCKFYKDGSYLSGEDGSSLANSIHDNNQRFQIGCFDNNTTPSNFFDGLIDEVRIWSDIRTAQEISDNYDAELAGDEAGLEAYYPFETEHGVVTAVKDPISPGIIPFAR